MYKNIIKKYRYFIALITLLFGVFIAFNLFSNKYSAGPPQLPKFFNTMTGSTTLDSNAFDIVDPSLIKGEASCNVSKSKFVVLVSDKLQTYGDLIYRNLLESSDKNKFLFLSITNDQALSEDDFERLVTSNSHKYFIGSKIFEPVKSQMQDVTDLNGFVKNGQIVIYVFGSEVKFCDNTEAVANKAGIDRSGYHLVYAQGPAVNLIKGDNSGLNELEFTKAYLTDLISSKELLNANDLNLGFHWLLAEYKVSESELETLQENDIDLDGVANANDLCDGEDDNFNQTEFDTLVDTVGCSLRQAGEDTDSDGRRDEVDNCPEIINPNQDDLDNDGRGDVCDSDIDGDRTENDDDFDPFDSSEQSDTDRDGVGDNSDNCPRDPNSDQADANNNNIGDACDGDADIDGDGWSNAREDECRTDKNDSASVPSDSDFDNICDQIEDLEPNNLFAARVADYSVCSESENILNVNFEHIQNWNSIDVLKVNTDYEYFYPSLTIDFLDETKSDVLLIPRATDNAGEFEFDLSGIELTPFKLKIDRFINRAGSYSLPPTDSIASDVLIAAGSAFRFDWGDNGSQELSIESKVVSNNGDCYANNKFDITINPITSLVDKSLGRNYLDMFVVNVDNNYDDSTDIAEFELRFSDAEGNEINRPNVLSPFLYSVRESNKSNFSIFEDSLARTINIPNKKGDYVVFFVKERTFKPSRAMSFDVMEDRILDHDDFVKIELLPDRSSGLVSLTNNNNLFAFASGEESKGITVFVKPFNNQEFLYDKTLASSSDELRANLFDFNGLSKHVRRVEMGVQSSQVEADFSRNRVIYTTVKMKPWYESKYALIDCYYYDNKCRGEDFIFLSTDTNIYYLNRPE